MLLFQFMRACQKPVDPSEIGAPLTNNSQSDWNWQGHNIDDIIPTTFPVLRQKEHLPHRLRDLWRDEGEGMFSNISFTIPNLSQSQHFSNWNKPQERCISYYFAYPVDVSPCFYLSLWLTDHNRVQLKLISCVYEVGRACLRALNFACPNYPSLL